MKFTNIEQVQNEFMNQSNGSSKLAKSNVRYQDISEHAESLEYLLNTEYNTISGYTFSEVMEALSHVTSNTTVDYLNDCKMNKSCINESFLGTTQAQAQFPVLNKGLVLYMYEKSVLPYLAHVFDLKGNRGLAYYMNLTATNSVGDVHANDIIASPKVLSKQTTNFVSTKINNLAVETTISGQDTYTFPIAPAPIQPQSLIITVDGVSGHLQDLSNDVSGIVFMTNIDGKVGDATVDLNTGIVTLVLAVAPAQSGLNIRATFNRDVQTEQGGISNQARVAPKLESVQLEAEDFSVFTETNLQQQRLAQVIFGTDWNEEVDNMLGMVYNKEIANKVTADISSQIPTASLFSYDITPNANTGDNRLFNTSYFGVVLRKLNTMISKASGLTGLSKLSCLITNMDLIPVLESQPKFVSVDAGENYMGGMALVGTYDGIPVLAAYEPILASGEIIGLFKSQKQAFLAPAVFGEFITPVIRDVFDYNNLAINRKQLIASAASKVVAPTLASKITVTGLDTIGLM